LLIGAGVVAFQLSRVLDRLASAVLARLDPARAA